MHPGDAQGKGQDFFAHPWLRTPDAVVSHNIIDKSISIMLS
jgi:hypothetical protein